MSNSPPLFSPPYMSHSAAKFQFTCQISSESLINSLFGISRDWSYIETRKLTSSTSMGEVLEAAES